MQALQEARAENECRRAYQGVLQGETGKATQEEGGERCCKQA